MVFTCIAKCIYITMEVEISLFFRDFDLHRSFFAIIRPSSGEKLIINVTHHVPVTVSYGFLLTTVLREYALLFFRQETLSHLHHEVLFLQAFVYQLTLCQPLISQRILYMT